MRKRVAMGLVERAGIDIGKLLRVLVCNTAAAPDAWEDASRRWSNDRWTSLWRVTTSS